MGSFCKPSKVTSTSKQTSSTAPPDYIADAYKRLLPQLESVAAAPWDPATQQQVAGFSAPQMQGFEGVQNMQGAYQPYMQAAGAYTGLGALPATASVGNYMNPFIGNVVNAAMNDWQEQSRRTMQDVNSNAAKVGALTGDRSQVAQQLAREGTDRAMASNIANLYSQGYTQALGAAQTDAARALQAGQQFGTLGGLAQQYGYADVNALMGIGGMQQGLQQAQYDAATQNAMARAQYPFQTAQWLTGNLTGLGSAAGSTSTGTGKQTTPGPSMFQQAAGLGIAALGAFSDERIKRDISEVGQTYDGQPIYRYRMAGSPKFQIGLMAQDVEQTHPEAVGEMGGVKMVNYDMATRDAARPQYADGGVLPYGKGLSYVPSVQVSGRGLQASPLPEMSKAAPASSGMDSLLSNYQQAKSAIEGGQKFGSWLRTTNDPDSGWSTTVNPSGSSGWGNYLGSMFKGFGFSHGGRVGYADGGDVDDGWDDEDYDAFYGEGSVVGTSPVAPPPVSVGVVPPAHARTVVALPEERKPTPGLLGLNFSDPVRRGLMTAGFGMLASTSPNFGVALGQGGLAGVKAYNDALSDEDNLALKRSALATKAMTEAQRSAIAQARVDAAEEANRIRQAQIEAMMPYRTAQIENMRSLAEQREFKKRLLESLGMGAPPETPEGDLLKESSVVTPAAPTVELAADAAPTPEGPARFAAPGLTLVDDRSAPAPEAVTPAPASPDTMITLPNGKKLTPEEAQRMGMGLLLDPDTAALGKYLMEQAQAKIGGAATMGQPAKNTLEEKALNATELLSRLDEIGRQYDESYLRVGTQVGQWWNEMKSKFISDAMTPAQKDDLIKATSFRATALDNVNQYIKEITGAAMSVAEAERILKTQPNPGMGVLNGVWDADGPDVFKAKLDNMVKKTRMALVRYAYLRKQGFEGSAEDAASKLSLEGMEKVVNDRAAAIRRDILAKNPKLKGGDVTPLIRRELKKEFGLEI